MSVVLGRKSDDEMRRQDENLRFTDLGAMRTFGDEEDELHSSLPPQSERDDHETDAPSCGGRCRNVRGDVIFDVSMVVFTYLAGIDLVLKQGSLVFSGYLICLFTLLPLCPFVGQDLRRRRWKQALTSSMGAFRLFTYEGAAAAPEAALFSAVTGTVPVLTVAAAACGTQGNGTDLFLTGGPETVLSDWSIFLATLFSGAYIASAAGGCVAALQKASASESAQHEGRHWLVTLRAAVVHGLDAVLVVVSVGIVGSDRSHAYCSLWIFVLWMLFGVLPLLLAPLPLPTLQGHVQGSDWHYLFYMASASVLVSALPLLEYVALLTQREQQVWCAAALLRAGFLILPILDFGWDDWHEDVLDTTVFLCTVVSVAHTVITCVATFAPAIATPIVSTMLRKPSKGVQQVSDRDP